MVQLYHVSGTLFFLSLSYGFPARITLFSQLAAILGTTFQIRRAVRGKSAVIFDFRE